MSIRRQAAVMTPRPRAHEGGGVIELRIGQKETQSAAGRDRVRSEPGRLGRGIGPLLAALVALAGLLAASAPAAAAGTWFPVTLPCAGISGVMRDGNWTNGRAAAEHYSMPYPFGTVVQLADGSRWTIEDTTAPWIGRWWGRGEHLDLYLSMQSYQCRYYGVWGSRARIIRWGWWGSVLL